MRLTASRLRRYEILAGVSGVVLLVSMFGLGWYRRTTGAAAGRLRAPASLNGWQALTGARWAMALTALAALALVVVQATRQAPALPVSISVLVTILAGLTTLILLYRVLITQPLGGNVVARAGAFVGLIAAAGILCGGYGSMRDERRSPHDERHEIPLITPRGEGGS